MSFKLSPSSLNLFIDCPRCFYLQLNKIKSRPRGIFPSLPSGMDRVLKHHFDHFRTKNELPPELSELKDGSKLFIDDDLMRQWRNNFKGLQWTDKNGNLLRGAIDDMLIRNSKLIVLDYKTRGYPLKEYTHKHYQNQLNLYSFLLQKNGYKTEDYAYLLFYHPTSVKESGDVVFQSDLIKMKTNTRDAEKLFKNALECLEGEEPAPSENCEYCTPS